MQVKAFCNCNVSRENGTKYENFQGISKEAWIIHLLPISLRRLPASFPARFVIPVYNPSAKKIKIVSWNGSSSFWKMILFVNPLARE